MSNADEGITQYHPDKKRKNAKNDRLPGISLRLHSPAQLTELSTLVLGSKLSRNEFCLKRIFGAGDTTGDTHYKTHIRFLMQFFQKHKDYLNAQIGDEEREMFREIAGRLKQLGK